MTGARLNDCFKQTRTPSGELKTDSANASMWRFHWIGPESSRYQTAARRPALFLYPPTSTTALSCR